MGESSGRPIQLIKIDRNGKISIGVEALEIICSYNEPIGFVSLAGKTRTGKSCLLNRMLHIKGDGVQQSLCSLGWIHRLAAALKAFGCGQIPSETRSIIT